MLLAQGLSCGGSGAVDWLWSFQGELGRQSALKLLGVTDFIGPLQRLSVLMGEQLVRVSERTQDRSHNRCHLNSEVTYHRFCHILCIFKGFTESGHTKGENITPGLTTRN